MANWNPRANEIFLDALEVHDPLARNAFVDHACHGETDLCEQVHALLHAGNQAGSFLDQPAIDPILKGTIEFASYAETASFTSSEMIGTRIGPYKLLQQIGEGGMGTVYMAEQTEPVRRQVALKLIKTGMDTKQVLARFEAERQALALMDHPNIARVLDASATPAGRPYFVMELVKGMPLTRYCDDSRLLPKDRLELFVQVCHAVQHAHHKGIIHRDLKPSNVLVAPYDGKPVVKVIDFGVAKATGQHLTDSTLVTGIWAVLGTPEYMSPEQAEVNNQDIDTRSDVYSLGVLLYELLTGTTPLTRKRVKGAALLDVLRQVREEETPRPSTRLSTVEELPSIASNRGLEPRKLSGLVRGELDWIVMKALEKERNRRYETATGLAADVDRYLKNEPVLACPPTAGYRLWKFTRQYKRAVMTASLVVCVLVLGIIGTTWGMFRANAAETDAVREGIKKSEALGDRETALTTARQSKRVADEQLFESYLAQAHANRLTRRSGQRFQTLEVLKNANRMAHELGLPQSRFHELRDAVAATLALPDIYPTGLQVPGPTDGYGFDFDEAHALFASTDRQGNCVIRRVADGMELHRLDGLGHPAIPHFSRDGKLLIVQHFDHTKSPLLSGLSADLWAIEPTGTRKIWSEQAARWVVFHPDGQHFATAYNDGGIALFELPSGLPSGQRLPPSELTDEIVIALHPKAPLVVVGSYFARTLQLRDTRTGEVVESIPQHDGVTNVAWHPDGQTFAVGYGTSLVIKLYDRTTLLPIRTLSCEQGGTKITFNHKGDRFVASGWGALTELFDTGTGQKLFEVAGGVCRFSDDNRRLGVCTLGGKSGIFNVGDGREFRTLVREPALKKLLYTSVSVHPDSKMLAAGMTDGFGVWDIASGEDLAFVPLDAGSEGIRALQFEPSGSLLTAGFSGLFRWPVGTDAAKHGRLTIGPPQRLLDRAMHFDRSADSRVIAVANRATGLWIPSAGGWILHADRPSEPIRIDAGADVHHAAVSPNGEWVVTCTFNTGIAKVWNARDGRFVKQLTEYGATLPRFSPDGQRLTTSVTGGPAFAVGSWEPAEFSGVAVAPAGDLVAMNPLAGVTALHDRGTGRELTRLQGPHSHATGLHCFTPDGSKLIELGNTEVKGIHVWDLRLIRDGLKEMGLEGDWPAFPRTTAERGIAKPPKVEVLLLTREQKARQAIDKYRLELKAKPDNASSCNNLAWEYATGPESLRDVKAAITLAENAVRIVPNDLNFRNTLGVVYYRAERYREAAEVLRGNLVSRNDRNLSIDLYFLAMSHHRLGDAVRAREYFVLADREGSPAHESPTPEDEELVLFRAEAAKLLGVKIKKTK